MSPPFNCSTLLPRTIPPPKKSESSSTPASRLRQRRTVSRGCLLYTYKPFFSPTSGPQPAMRSMCRSNCLVVFGHWELCPCGGPPGDLDKWHIPLFDSRASLRAISVFLFQSESIPGSRGVFVSGSYPSKALGSKVGRKQPKKNLFFVSMRRKENDVAWVLWNEASSFLSSDCHKSHRLFITFTVPNR